MGGGPGGDVVEGGNRGPAGSTPVDTVVKQAVDRVTQGADSMARPRTCQGRQDQPARRYGFGEPQPDQVRGGQEVSYRIAGAVEGVGELDGQWFAQQGQVLRGGQRCGHQQSPSRQPQVSPPDTSATT